MKLTDKLKTELYELLAAFFIETMMLSFYAWGFLMLWNAVSIDIFSLPKIDYGQALVLTVLDRLLLFHIPQIKGLIK